MKTGVEFDFVVSDSLAALKLYESIFEVERVEVTDMPKGLNEVVFNLYGTRFHMLDQNPEYQLEAPQPGARLPFWFNVMVPDIKKHHDAALKAGCTEIQPVTEMQEFGVSNSAFADPFGYQWMLHQMHREVSFEERMQHWQNGEQENQNG